MPLDRYRLRHEDVRGVDVYCEQCGCPLGMGDTLWTDADSGGIYCRPQCHAKAIRYLDAISLTPEAELFLRKENR